MPNRKSRAKYKTVNFRSISRYRSCCRSLLSEFVVGRYVAGAGTLAAILQQQHDRRRCEALVVEVRKRDLLRLQLYTRAAVRKQPRADTSHRPLGRGCYLNALWWLARRFVRWFLMRVLPKELTHASCVLPTALSTFCLPSRPLPSHPLPSSPLRLHPWPPRRRSVRPSHPARPRARACARVCGRARA